MHRAYASLCRAGREFSSASPGVKLQGISSALWTFLEGNPHVLTE